MPSYKHDGLVSMFAARPDLVLPLLRALSVEVPVHAGVTSESADFTSVEPASRHADAAVALRDADGAAVQGVVVEVQLRVKPEKRFAWPQYLANSERSCAATWSCWW